MKFKNIMIGGIIIAATGVFALGCQNNDKSLNINEPIKIGNIKEEYERMQKENEHISELNKKYEEKIEQLQKNIKVLEESIEDYEGKEEKSNGYIKEIAHKEEELDKIEEMLFLVYEDKLDGKNDLVPMPIYGYNEGGIFHIKDWIILSKKYGVEVAINSILEKITAESLKDCNITLKEIKDGQEGKTAFVEVECEKEILDKNSNLDGLKFSLLQPEYGGEWVDAVDMKIKDSNESRMFKRADIIKQPKYRAEEFLGEEGKRYIYKGGFENFGEIYEVLNKSNNTIKILNKSLGGDFEKLYTLNSGEVYYTNKTGVAGLENVKEEKKILLKEPIEVGSNWSEESGRLTIITDIFKEYKIDLGTFEDVVEVTRNYSGGNMKREYYAKGVGLIKVDDIYDLELDKIEDMKLEY